MANSVRNKTGMLRMKSEFMFKKDKWNLCTVKVSSSIYLLYFNSDNLGKPDGTLMLSTITKVEPHTAKDPRYAFEVHFKDKKTSPSSPWIFDTISSEERIAWMEAIKPGSAELLKQMLATRNSLTSPTPTITTNPRLSQVSTMSHPRKQSDPLIESTVQSPFESPTRSLPVGLLTSSLECSRNPPKAPQMYEEPTHLSDTRPTESLSATIPRQNGQPPPLPRRPNHTFSHKARPHRPQLSAKSSSELSFPFSQPEDTGTYEVMDPGVTEEPPQQTTSKATKPIPKPRNRTSIDSAIKTIEPPSSPTDDILDENDDGDYLILVDTKTRPTLEPKTPTPSNGQPGISSDVAEQLMKSFNREQLKSLIQMLQQVQEQSQQEDGVASPDGCGPESSLRGNFKRMLSTAPQLTSEKMLVVDDDSDDSYEPRPEWAKAVTQRGMVPTPEERQLDSLSALQEDALTIYREDLTDLELIGEGQFGQVFRGILERGVKHIEVAVKTTKKSSEQKAQQAFLKEMTIMSNLMHPNIVRLYGLVQKDVPAPWIVLEYLHKGDLKAFLTSNKRPLNVLVKYMVDVSMGMHYLSEKGLVHRDLAARNILVSENETCKVADFGLLRELPKDDSFYHMESNVPCPVRWMPPESIADRNFSTASDVWSFGILIWEMFNPSKTPYTTFSNIEVATKVIKGYRLPTPRTCPPVVARIMKACWQENPKKRPSFLLISTILTTRVSFPPDPVD